MSTQIHPHRPFYEVVIMAAAVIFAFILAHLVFGCGLIPEPLKPTDYVYHAHPPAPVVIDTPCVPVEIVEPKFLTMYLDLGEPQTEVFFQAGNYSTTMYLDQPGKKDSIISVLNHFNPAYTYKVYLTNWFQFAVIIEGTNDKTLFQLKVHTRSDSLNQWPTFSIQAFYWGGILTCDEYKELVKIYPSVRSFNFRDLDCTPSQVDTISLAILKCKLGRERADFRWGGVNDSIPPLFIAAGWNQVISAFGSYGLPRELMAEDGSVIDLSNYHPSDDIILYYLNIGSNVITRA